MELGIRSSNWKSEVGEEKVLGKEHPSTLTSMNNLAEVLSRQGKYDEAERLSTSIKHGQD